VLQRLTAGESVERLGLGKVGDRVDIRDLSIPFAGPIENMRLEKLDLTGVTMNHARLRDCHFVDCTFDRGTFFDLKLRRTSLENCSFVGADLENAGMGGWHGLQGNRYSQVDFTRANLEGIASDSADYKDCNFANAKLSKVNFGRSRFARCTFAGRLHKVTFDGRKIWNDGHGPGLLEDVDLARAALEECQFRGVDFDRVTLPDDPDIFLVYRSSGIERAISKLPNDPNADFMPRFNLLMIKAALEDGPTLVNVRDFGAASEMVRECLINGFQGPFKFGLGITDRNR
jgi:uncharacterized protein YjbI with pentapeptide repeats